MMQMDIQAEKLHLIEWIARLKDTSMIEKIKALEASGDDDRISIEQYNKEIEEANARIEAGDYVTHEDVVKESASWLK